MLFSLYVDDFIICYRASSHCTEMPLRSYLLTHTSDWQPKQNNQETKTQKIASQSDPSEKQNTPENS